MNEKAFDPMQFYSSYPTKVICRPGYPARAAFKSTLLFGLYGSRVFREIDKVSAYADIGGCFGFSANAMGFHISKRQGAWPRTMVFEMASNFVAIGKIMFPHIEFIEAEFRQWNGDIKVFDLITLFDVVEHVVGPESFLKRVASRGRYVMLKTPLETSGEWRVTKPPGKVGANHPDGHINFFTPKAYEALLANSDLEIIQYCIVPTIIPVGAKMALLPENVEERTAKHAFSAKNLARMVFKAFLAFIRWRANCVEAASISACVDRD